MSGVLGGTAGEAGKQTWGKLARLVRGWFNRDDPTTRALEQVDLVAADQQMVEAVGGVLAQRLSDSARRDPRFAAELRAWMIEAARVINADGDAETGTGGPMVTESDRGGMDLGTPPPESA